MEASPVDDSMLMGLLKQALTDEIHDKHLLFSSLDASWNYEGYSNYRIKGLTVRKGDNNG